MMKTFNEFVDKKRRHQKRYLNIIRKMLEQNGTRIANHVDDEEPYIFAFNNVTKLSFDGVRIYNIGDSMAYRVQKEEKTHPYGKAYVLDVEEIYNDLLSDNKKSEEAAQAVIKAVSEEVTKFFEKSSEAETELQSRELEKRDTLGKVAIKSTGTDYSNTLSSKGTQYGG